LIIAPGRTGFDSRYRNKIICEGDSLLAEWSEMNSHPNAKNDCPVDQFFASKTRRSKYEFCS
jgi:hypothetical protein